MTAHDIEMALTQDGAPFDRRRYLVVPNITWGMGFLYELDLLALSAAGSAHEVEIKVSGADLRRDQDKRHVHDSARIHCLWYAVPAELTAMALELGLAHGGVIAVSVSNSRWRCAIMRRPQRRAVPKWTERDRYRLARLGCMRYWDAREQVERLRREMSSAGGG